MSERMQAEHERFMAAALKEAQRARDLGNAACGAVIMRDGEVLATGYNEVTSTFDITAHAEAAAIRKLTTMRRLLNPGSQADSGPFAGAILYSTLEPCPMCCWLTCIVGVSTLVIGARHADLDISFGGYTVEKLIQISARRLRVVTGILTEECMAMYRSGPYKPGPR
jgi:tRNA(adenine34) deaminase